MLTLPLRVFVIHDSTLVISRKAPDTLETVDEVSNLHCIGGAQLA